MIGAKSRVLSNVQLTIRMGTLGSRPTRFGLLLPNDGLQLKAASGRCSYQLLIVTRILLLGMTIRMHWLLASPIIQGWPE